jgi:hypothetical protein
MVTVRRYLLRLEILNHVSKSLKIVCVLKKDTRTAPFARAYRHAS